MNLENFYRSLYLIRRAEEAVVRVYPSDKIKSPVHLSIGQEAISVGVCQALEPEDIVFGTYRSHALYLSKTADLNGFFAELYGKSTGCSKGKGGSMHLANVAKGMMGKFLRAAKFKLSWNTPSSVAPSPIKTTTTFFSLRTFMA